MASLTIELPPQQLQTAFNLRRWAEVLADRELAKFEWRIETDRHGYVIMNPPPAAKHGMFQSQIAYLLKTLVSGGRVLTECPISTADGVRATDVAWAAPESVRELGDLVCFPRAPEICVEVLSPGNTKAEIREKAALYFDAGAQEVWLCGETGAMTFLRAGDNEPMGRSIICPEFPAQIRLSEI
jgi:Uma2 family endonuclease